MMSNLIINHACSKYGVPNVHIKTAEQRSANSAPANGTVSGARVTWSGESDLSVVEDAFGKIP